MRPLASLISLFALIALPVSAEALRCENQLVTVKADDPAFAAQVCELVAKSSRQLNACHLKRTHPLTIRVLRDASDMAEACLGSYNCTISQIDVLHPDTLPETFVDDSPYAEMDTMVYFNSLLTHELAHSAFEQLPCEREACTAEQEYIAYAMQLGSLPNADRQIILDAKPVSFTVTLESLNSTIAMMAPTVFAARVWQHFSKPENGCNFIGKIIDGKVSLRHDRF